MATELSSSAVPTGVVRTPPCPDVRTGRAGGAIVVSLLAVAMSVATLGHTQQAAAVDPTGADAAAAWLAGQLDEGTYRNPLAGGPDYGLMIDAVFAMTAAGRGELAAPIIDVLDDGGAIAYASYVSFLPGEDRDRVSGAVAKLLVVAEVAGRDPHDFGGLDLVAETRAAVIAEGPEAGRLTDRGPNIAFNNSNTFGQTLAVIGLVGADAHHGDVVRALLRQQCAPGYFRIFFTTNPDGSPATCDEAAAMGAAPPDGDATGFALQALVAARAHGTGGLDAPIDAAVGWLVANQDSGGGWGGGVSTAAPNTNSTGLIVQALAGAHADRSAITRGEAYLVAAQVRGDGGVLATEEGAIAYTPADRQSARTTGITARDTWIRATAQASLGLSQIDFAGLVDTTTSPPPTATTPTTSAPPSTPPVVDTDGPTSQRDHRAAPGSAPPLPDPIGRPAGPLRTAPTPSVPTTATRPADAPVPTPRRSGLDSEPSEVATASRPEGAGREASRGSEADTESRKGPRTAPARPPVATTVVTTSRRGPGPVIWVIGGAVAVAACVSGLRVGARSRGAV